MNLIEVFSKFLDPADISFVDGPVIEGGLTNQERWGLSTTVTMKSGSKIEFPGYTSKEVFRAIDLGTAKRGLGLS